MASNQTTTSGTGHTLITGPGRKVMSKRDVDAWTRVKNSCTDQQNRPADTPS